ncbi:ABC transporter ATP-binding protein [Halorubrum lipolyticum]|uniref:Peptide ABC transporter ATP-binding protein n=1 Tax=Halorubrum lipolyticum DSM 21995 TaxID=1227482 RepID=M0NPY1_9EURY|nr:ABC transporter ATP-binding protein [Halorubrum lipolyticum]EMA59678.1 peptide ABC transporter ATP-binding protein [Halorubrum lipolyticum DSM 21995]
MSGADPVVSMQDITVEFGESGFGPFGDSEVVRAVDEVDLDIGEGEVIALVGESGCGKTTLGKTAIGFQRPTGGTIRYRGQDIGEARDSRNPDIPFSEIRRSLQIIHQDPGSALNPNQRVITSLLLPLKKNTDLGRGECKERIYALAERVGLTPVDDFMNRYPHQLSGGEQQRTVLIRAMMMNPDLILADEAISALDVSLRIEMMDLMLELRELFNTSFLFVSHDLSNARYLTKKSGGRIAVMYLGEIVEIGTVEEIIENPQHPYTQALKWATPNLFVEDEEDSPLRGLDIPDPTEKPEGCSFHPRCPEARTVCETTRPGAYESDDSEYRCKCFRATDEHEYWNSEELAGSELVE